MRGLATAGNDSTRRVAGLRRAEVAMLAGVSPDYYTRLERGNLSGVSDSVLDAIARALQLDDAERSHLYDLARAANPTARTRARRPTKQPIRPGVQSLRGHAATGRRRPDPDRLQRRSRHPGSRRAAHAGQLGGD